MSEDTGHISISPLLFEGDVFNKFSTLYLLQVIMGGGRKFMTPKNMSDVEYPTQTKHNGTRKDGRNLVQEWIDRTKNKVHFLFPRFTPFAFMLPFINLITLLIF